jgi:hypothetical protein
MPFPRILRWTLLAPVVAFALAVIAPKLFSPVLSDNFLKGAFLAITAAAGLVELFAVPAALFMLLRGGPYVTLGNVLITLVAAIPLAFVGVIVLVLKFGHFHI